MAYRLEITPAAERDLRALPAAILVRLDGRIRALADNPRPRGVEPIRRRRGGLRLRVGDYRILYTLDDAQQVVIVGRVGHRRDVYRGF